MEPAGLDAIIETLRADIVALKRDRDTAYETSGRHLRHAAELSIEVDALTADRDALREQLAAVTQERDALAKDAERWQRIYAHIDAHNLGAAVLLDWAENVAGCNGLDGLLEVIAECDALDAEAREAQP